MHGSSGQPLALPLGVNDLAVGGGAVATGAEPELHWIAAALIAVLALFGWVEAQKRRTRETCA